jgi:hypothetical protein
MQILPALRSNNELRAPKITETIMGEKNQGQDFPSTEVGLKAGSTVSNDRGDEARSPSLRSASKEETGILCQNLDLSAML